MSIIHEALKKAQKTMGQKPLTNLTSLAQKVNPQPKKQKSPWFLFIILILLITGGTIVLMSRIHIVHQKQNPSGSSVKAPYAVVPLESKISTPQAAAASIKPPIETTSTLAPQQPLPKTTVPTQPSSAQEAPVSTLSDPHLGPASAALNIQGIMTNNNHNVVLINNNIYDEGSIFDGIKILKINLDAITIERDGKEESIAIKK